MKLLMIVSALHFASMVQATSSTKARLCQEVCWTYHIDNEIPCRRRCEESTRPTDAEAQECSKCIKNCSRTYLTSVLDLYTECRKGCMIKHFPEFCPGAVSAGRKKLKTRGSSQALDILQSSFLNDRPYPVERDICEMTCRSKGYDSMYAEGNQMSDCTNNCLQNPSYDEQRFQIIKDCAQAKCDARTRKTPLTVDRDAHAPAANTKASGWDDDNLCIASCAAEHAKARWGSSVQQSPILPAEEPVPKKTPSPNPALSIITIYVTRPAPTLPVYQPKPEQPKQEQLKPQPTLPIWIPSNIPVNVPSEIPSESYVFRQSSNVNAKASSLSPKTANPWNEPVVTAGYWLTSPTSQIFSQSSMSGNSKSRVFEHSLFGTMEFDELATSTSASIMRVTGLPDETENDTTISGTGNQKAGSKTFGSRASESTQNLSTKVPTGINETGSSSPVFDASWFWTHVAWSTVMAIVIGLQMI